MAVGSAPSPDRGHVVLAVWHLQGSDSSVRTSPPMLSAKVTKVSPVRETSIGVGHPWLLHAQGK